ncbi:ABC transporter permease subunit [Algicola sagamiensis]|uniref:ABC transporter permease subunit n=1 Tax=Algicola sagamiensis TaxID=163869 RepID=UPI003899370D
MMSKNKAITVSTSPWRTFKDKLAQYSVTTGGCLVLVALLLIFFYLLYVVEPVFHGAEVAPRAGTGTYTVQQNTLALGMEEQSEIAYQFEQTGILKFYQIEESKALAPLRQVTVLSEPVQAFAYSAPHQNTYLYASGRSILFVRPEFKISYPDNVRQITPEVSYPMGRTLIPVVPEGEQIQHVAFAWDEDQIGVASITEAGNAYFSTFEGEENFMTGEITWSSDSQKIAEKVSGTQALLMAPNVGRVFLIAKNQLQVFDTRDVDDISTLYQLPVNEMSANVLTASLLSGANSILIANDNGMISQWFEVNEESGRQLKEIRRFETNMTGINGIYPEFFRKTFFVTSENGQLSAFHTTNHAELWQGDLGDTPIRHLGISPRSDTLILQDGNQLKVFDVANEHPEVSWEALWSEIWYEGYQTPAYTWQSTSASDDFEPKFSLVPISFGTMKAAFYAMLFSVPIAIAAAIYTAYFMSSGMRKVVKPTIEIMEALPTVILGFLAGLWLAPIMENHLPGVVLLLLALPISTLSAALLWHYASPAVKNKVPEGWDAIVLIPVVLIAGAIALGLGPIFEELLFDGNVREFITNDLGIDYSQRNALVVGIAMGFAVIPTIFSITEDAIFSVPKHLSNGSLALGATRWQTLTRVVLLTASPGIFSAVMMGLGRAVGETMIVLMATGNTPIMDWNIFQGMRTLSANIAVEMPESEVGSSHYRILFLAAFVLFIFTFLFNTVAEFVRQRLRDKYSSL